MAGACSARHASSRTWRLGIGVLGTLVVVPMGLEVHVETSFGGLIGEHELFSGCDRWLGVPFAEPPIGSLRFEPPKSWQQPFPPQGRRAVSPGSMCVQRGLDAGDALAGREDCLYLNIWRPHNVEPTAKLAVMFWVHGGSFIFGSGLTLPPLPNNIYDGCKLASEQQVVFVSINYRLGPFGFTAFQDTAGDVRSNFGMLDQREALRWVGMQISSFGGDPEKITMFGESAGGVSTLHHAVSPQSRGLFRAGISQSGFPDAHPVAGAISYTTRMAEKSGCVDVSTQLACLRGKSAEEVMSAADDAMLNVSAGQNLQLGPVIDGVELPEHPLALWKQGKSHVAALMAGTNTDEGAIWAGYGPNTTAKSITDFDDFLKTAFSRPPQNLTPSDLQSVRNMYPAVGPDTRPLISQVITDFMFLCGTHFAMRAQSQLTDAFVYRFNRRADCPILGPDTPGVFHEMELPYVFGDAVGFGCVPDVEDENLSKKLMRAWGDFAKFLDPSHSNPGSFPKYSADSQQNVILTAPADAVEADYRLEFCKLWEDVLFSKLMAPGTRRRLSDIII
mmetsp:Transcript_98122/g.245987  ORF Transcript_98122/g.245987 Transcript_98122/m.245987 type:complete len:560 (-) Transcript_98122:506-2185(-)